jgi:hypothetical protein
MNKATVLLFATTLAFGASTVVLFQELQDQREENRALRQAAASRETVSTSSEIAASTAVAAAVTPPPPQTPRAKKAVLQQPTQADDQSREEQDAKKWATQELARLSNSKYRASLLARNRLSLEQRHSDLARVLDIGEGELGRFLDLLAQQQLEQHEREMSLMLAAQSKEEDTPDARRERKQAMQEQVDAQRRALLGESRYQAWTDYVNTLPTRNAINQLRVKLVDAGVPLRSDQVEPLVADLSAERRSHEAERDGLYSSQRSNYNASPSEVIKYMNQRLKLVEEHLDRAHDIAAAHLTSDQLELFDAMLEQQRRQVRVETNQSTTSAKLQQRGQ